MSKETPETFIELLSDRMKSAQVRPVLFRAVAEIIRSRLDPRDAAIIARWFDRIAEGENPAQVLTPSRRGRPKDAVGQKYVKGKHVKRPDDLILCWQIRRAIHEGHEATAVFAEVANRYGLEPGTVSDLYRDALPTLATDPDST